MNIDGKQVAISPGMNVTAEIKTGERRVIEYLLSPIPSKHLQPDSNPSPELLNASPLPPLSYPAVPIIFAWARRLGFDASDHQDYKIRP